MLDDIYAEHGPFGPEADLESERLFDAMTLERQHQLMLRFQSFARQIALQRKTNSRPKPSDTLISIGTGPALNLRKIIVNLAATAVDRKGELSRNDQCVAFACCVRAMLIELGIPARVLIGKATYEMNDVRHEMWHAWVVAGGNLIDGNADSFGENLMIPEEIRPQPYWGPEDQAPNRTFEVVRELLLEREIIEVDEQFDDLRRQVIQQFRKRLAEFRPEV